MKTRILSLLLSLGLLLPAFAGCTGEPESAPLSGSSGESGIPADDSDTAAEEGEWPIPDYAGFVMPEATDSLTLYASDFTDAAMRRAVDLFKERYPDVTVNYTMMGEDELEETMRAEIPAGRGPDVVMDYRGLLPDIYKSMSTGIFTDLGPYIANDGEINPGDYFGNVMKGGQMFGRQYMLPLTFEMSFLITSRELLDENGIDPDSLGTWEGFASACRTYRANNPDKLLLDFGGGLNQYYMSNLFGWSGMKMIDYEKNEVSFNEERFLDMMELCHLYASPEPVNLDYGAGHESVKNNECLFISGGIDTSVLAMNECECIRHFSAQTPVLFSVADENGGLSVQIGYFAAVPEASKNKLNAWRFVKILLSDAMQYGKEEAGKYPKTAFPTGNSVKKDAFERLTKLCKFWGGTEKEIGFVLDAAERITNAVMPTPVIRRYVITIMREYVTDPDGTNYDKQFEKLINTLELYKDE